MKPQIREWSPSDDTGWDRHVLANVSSRNCHLTAWKRIVERAFGHQTYYLVSEDVDGQIDGVLPMARLRSWLFGDFMVSLPFLNYGGPCASDEGTAKRLVEAGTTLASSLGVRHLEIRTERPTDYGLTVRSAKVSMRISLPDTADDLWRQFPAKLRSQVNRAQREGMNVRIGGAEELDAFYSVFAVNMRDLGTPVYGKQFFAEILAEFAGDARICCIYLGAIPVAAGFLLAFRDTLEIPWASALRAFNRLSPNMLLYWSVLKYGCEQHYRVFDFGRSSPDSGPYRFKAQWGAQPVPLYWHYWLRPGVALPDLSPRNPRMQAAIRVWQRLPIGITRLLGPRIVKNLP
jgi:serine/alanine adding enzyme